MLERSPLGRMTTAEDIAAGAVPLQRRGANISGQVLPVNAGEPAGYVDRLNLRRRVADTHRTKVRWRAGPDGTLVAVTV